MSTSLVIGGTGMLAGATQWLMARSARTVVVARRAGRFAAMKGIGEAIALDYDWMAPDFSAKMQIALDLYAPFSTALIWHHNPDPVMPALLEKLGSAHVVAVLGSGNGQYLPAWAQSVTWVRLGHKIEDGQRRWLTHDEICAGVVAALEKRRSRIVGSV